MARNKTATVTLRAQLETKGTDLRTKQANDADASQALAVASAEAAKQSETAGIHASAVERALKILDDAGVVL